MTTKHVDAWQQSQERFGSSGDRNEIAKELYMCCMQLFKRILAYPAGEKMLLFCQELRAEGQRFHFWGSNFDVLAGGLDVKLSCAPRTKSAVVSLLSDLGDSLIACGSEELGDEFLEASSSFKIITRLALKVASEEFGEENQAILTSENNSPDSDASSDCSALELEEIIEDVKSSITCLYGLSPVIQNPAEHLQPLRDKYNDREIVLSEVMWSAALPFINQVLDRYPLIDQKLAQRVGEANLKRYERLETKRKKAATFLDIDVPECDTNPSDPLPTVRSSLFDTSDKKFSYPRLGSSVATSISEFRDDDPTNPKGNSRGLPKMPDDRPWGEPFDCTVCGDRITVLPHGGWSQAGWM